MPRAQYDPLTGLLTEPAFHRLASRAARATGGSCGAPSLAVMAIRIEPSADLEGPYGPTEAAIRASAERLVGCVRVQDRVAHTGKGHFRVLLDPWSAAEVAAALAEKLGHVLRLPVAIDGQHYGLSASIGIALCPHDRPTASATIEQADACMQRVADAGGGYAFSDATLPASLPRGVELEADPREALLKGEFALHYQPRVSLHNNRVASAEALIRWTHPIHGNIPPSAFIPNAESTGFIRELGAWVLEQACTQAAQWQRRYGSAIQVSVNVSGRQLEEPGFVDRVQRTLEQTGLAAERLELEITESALMSRPEDIKRTLERIRVHGVSTALDDFGKGYSSLAYLQSFPLDTLKIDRSFINDVPRTAYSGVLLRGIVDLAHALGLRTVVEGVETPDQRAICEAQGVDEIQGFLMSGAVAPDAFARRFLGPDGRAPSHIAHAP